MEKKNRDKGVEVSGNGAVISGGVHVSVEVFGPSGIQPLRYRCPEHGVLLGTEIQWKRDGRPYCPTCEQPVEELAGED